MLAKSDPHLNFLSLFGLALCLLPLAGISQCEDEDADGDGWTTTDGDCNDADENIHPGATEYCNDRDDDCDGDVDEDVVGSADLITIGNSDRTIYAVDTSSGTSTAIASLDLSEVGDSTQYNSVSVNLETGESFVHDHANSRLLSLNPCTGSLSEIGPTYGGNTCGIAIGPMGLVYGIDSTNDTLVVYDTSTGAAAEVGPLGFNLDNCGLTYDCTHQVLYGMQVDTSNNTGKIFSLDVETGAGTDFVTLDSSVTWSGAGIEYNPSNDTFYAITASGIYEVDPSTGAATLLNSYGDNNISFLPDICD